MLRPINARARSRRLRREVLAAACGLEAHGLNNGTTGNVSARLGETFIITGSRQPYSEMRPRDLVAVGIGGLRERGRRRPSRESPLHAAIYGARPDVNAIVHHHGPFSSAWSISGRELCPRFEEEGYYGIGPVEVLELNRDRATAAALLTTSLADSNAALLRAHGLLAMGETVRHAYETALAVEHEARVAWLSLLAGWSAPRSADDPGGGALARAWDPGTRASARRRSDRAPTEP